MKLEKRIRSLEARLITEPVILRFAEGTTKEICGRSGFLLDLFCAACDGAELDPVQAAQLELIRGSVAAEEPGGGHMIELLRCFLAAPPSDSER